MNDLGGRGIREKKFGATPGKKIEKPPLQENKKSKCLSEEKKQFRKAFLGKKVWIGHPEGKN